MRPLTTKQEKAIQSGAYSVRLRVWIEDADGVFRNLCDLEGYDWVREVSWDEDIDQPVAQANIVLWRNLYYLNLSTFVESSKLNTDALGAYAPLLELGRQVRIETATVPLDTQPVGSDWEEVFLGEVEDIDLEGEDDASISLTCLDMGNRLQKRYIETDMHTYGADDGSVLAEDVMQAILNDNGLSDIVLRLPNGASGWAIAPYTQQKEPVMTALQNLAMQRAWDVRYKWYNDAFQLCFYQPDRSKTIPDYTFGPDHYLGVRRLSISRNGIRNVVQGVYTDAADGQRKTVVVPAMGDQDTDPSVVKYGRMWMEIAEDSNSQIDTEAEMLTMIAAAKEDLEEPKAEMEVELHYFWAVELGDLYRFRANGVQFDQDQDLAVVSLRHHIRGDQCRTTLTVRGKPAGAYTRWHLREARPGVAPAGSFPAAPTGLVLSTGVEHVGQDTWSYIEASWNKSADVQLDYYKIRWRKDPNGTPGEWVYADVPADPNPKFKIVPVAGTVEYGVQVAVVNRRGKTSQWSSEAIKKAARDTSAPAAPSGLTVTSHVRGIQATFTSNTEPDLAYYEWQKRIDGGTATTLAKDLVTERVIAGNAGESIEVRVRAVDTSGNASSFSSWVGATTGRVYVADITSMPGTALPNGSFELDTDQDGIPDEWEYDPASGGSCQVTSTYWRDGSKSVALSSGAKLLGPWFVARVGQTYTCYFQCKSSLTTTKGRVGVQCYDSDRNYLSTRYADGLLDFSNGSTGWIRYRREVYVSNTSTCWIRPFIIGGYGGTGTMYFDEFWFSPNIGLAGFPIRELDVIYVYINGSDDYAFEYECENPILVSYSVPASTYGLVRYRIEAAGSGRQRVRFINESTSDTYVRAILWEVGLYPFEY